MTTDKKPRKGTIAHYRERVAELANENAALKSAAYDATVGELVCQMRATIATERAEQAERERDGETARADGLATQNAALWSAVNDASTGALMFQARADGLARRLARVRDLLAYTRGRLSEARINRDEYRASANLRAGAADRWRDLAAAHYAELDKAKAAYASARLSCDELAGQVMALQVRLGEAQAASIAQYDARRRAERIGVAGICVALACIVAQVVWAVLS
jgi:chromosome segregation ATPase